MMSDMSPAALRIPRVLWAPLLLVGIYVSGTLSVLFAPQGTDVAIWWPAAGLAVILLVVHPRDRWWWLLVVGVVVSSGLANLTAGRSPQAALGFGLSNTAEATVVALWLQAGAAGRRPRLRTQEDLYRLLTGTVLGILVIGVGIGSTVALTMDGDFSSAASTVFLTHAASILVIVPLALMHGSPRHQATPRELAAQVVVLVASVGVVFGPREAFGFSFLTMPVLVWGALRLGARTVVWELAALAAATTTLTALRLGTLRGRRVPGHRRLRHRAAGPGLPDRLRGDRAAAGDRRRAAPGRAHPGDRQRGAVPAQLHRLDRRHGAAAPARRPAARHRGQRHRRRGAGHRRRPTSRAPTSAPC